MNMKTQRKLLSLLVLSFMMLFFACSKDDDNEQAAPSAPQITSEKLNLSIEAEGTTSFKVTISAAGKFKSISAETTIGTVATSNVQGVGETSASADIDFTAPDEDGGTGIVTITVKDENDKESTAEVNVSITSIPAVDVEAGEVSGEWGPHKTYIVKGDLLIPEGKSLKIREGVTVIIEGDGSQGGSYAIEIAGNFYSLGTEADPVLFTVPENLRKEENIFKGIWNGLIAMESCEEMALIHTRLEYVGGPAAAGTYIVESGEMDEGDPTGGFYFNNPDGRFVMMHSTIAYTKDDGGRISQGQLLVAHNTFILNGETGGENLNIKSGSVGDVAYNVFYSPAANGLKCSNSKNKDPQTDVNIYNNTALEGGWRVVKEGRGGSISLEKGARSRMYNNLVVNARYGMRFPTGDSGPDVANVSLGYTFYYGDDAEIVAGFYPDNGSVEPGDYETDHDVVGAAGENNPQFVNWDVTNFDSEESGRAELAKYPEGMDLRLKAGSPALSGGKTDFSPRLPSLTVDGKKYEAPLPSAFFGAKGAE